MRGRVYHRQRGADRLGNCPTSWAPTAAAATPVVLRQRLRLQGIPAEIVEITLADRCRTPLDLYTLGGAEDYAQRLATKHPGIRHPGLQSAAARCSVLAICAAIQVLGHWYERPRRANGVDGVGLLDDHLPQESRTIGEVAANPLIEGSPSR